jgi:hypothetical protein
MRVIETRDFKTSRFIKLRLMIRHCLILANAFVNHRERFPQIRDGAAEVIRSVLVRARV